jgi:hypothetical protein
MNNPYAMNMIVKQRQEEIRRQADLYRRIEGTDRIEESEGDFRQWWREKSAIARMSLMLAASVLGLSILV